MTDREMKIAAMAVITYVNIVQTGQPPDIGEDGYLEVGAYLETEAFELTLELLETSEIDIAELCYEEDEDDEDEP